MLTRAPLQHATTLSDICAAQRAVFIDNQNGSPDQRQRWRLIQHERDLQEQARAEFAKLNGWSPRYASEFQLYQIADRAPMHWWDRNIFDHLLFFKAHKRPAAIIGRPYIDKNDRWFNQAAILADRLGLALHIPPVPMACIHRPGGCAFLVFTRHEHSIRWFPEQERGVPGYAEQRIKRVRIVGRAA
jgi:hypothetical protein